MPSLSHSGQQRVKESFKNSIYVNASSNEHYKTVKVVQNSKSVAYFTIKNILSFMELTLGIILKQHHLNQVLRKQVDTSKKELAI